MRRSPIPTFAFVCGLSLIALLGAGPARADEPAQLLAPVTPVYPADALPERLAGEVCVQVTVGLAGEVTAVSYAFGGPDVFVAPAIAAAWELRFQPATREGAPVTTQLEVHFVFNPPPAPEPALEEPLGEGADEIVVFGARGLADHETHAVTTITVEALERSGGDDLGETLSTVPGVAVARGNSDATKPIIRGQVERRLLVLMDGVRHESQKWGLDHATEIDPFAAGEINVIKGAAGVRYGPDAIGGVVLVEPPPLREEPGIGGRAQVVGVSNGMRGVAAARLDGAPEAVPGLAWRVEGNLARGAALSTPTYVLGNTASQGWNAGATVGFVRGDLSLKASYRHFDLSSGVCYCVSNGTPDQLLSQLELDAPIGSELWTTSYDIDRPYQAVQHDVALARVERTLQNGGDLIVTYAFQSNRRQEYDQVRASVTGPQYDFTLRTHSLDGVLTHGERALRGGLSHTGGLGLAGTFQENVYNGLPLIPNFRAFQAGIYGYERLLFGAFEVEGGARYDHLARTAYLSDSSFQRASARGVLSEDDCALSDDVATCPATYDAASVSLGALWRALPDRLELRLDLSSASRFPNSDELYMVGSAPTFPVYAVGDPRLGPETTWGSSPTVGLRLPWVEVETSAYLNYIDDYIYFAPVLGEDGAPMVDVTIQGAFPRFSFRPIDVLFYGLDGGVTFGPELPVQLAVQGAVVRAHEASTGDPLIMIPPDRVETTLKGALATLGPLDEPFVQVSGLYVFEQTRVDADADIAPAPDAYLIFDAAVGAEIPLRRRALSVGLEARNLLNARYRDYTSLLRYYADEPGREMRLRVGIDL